jgi:hypothetical protein
MGSLTAIAEQLLAQAKEIDAYVASKELPPLSIRHETLKNLPFDLQSTCDSLIDGTANLRALVEAPAPAVMNIIYNVRDILIDHSTRKLSTG